MKKSIKKLISLALVMTMLLSTMMVVSAEGTIASEDVSFEEELMPLKADPCASNMAAGFTGKPYVYFYNGVNEINLRFNVTLIKTDPPNLYSSRYIECVDNMAAIADQYIHRDDDESDDEYNNEIIKAVWQEIRVDPEWDEYREYGNYSGVGEDISDYLWDTLPRCIRSMDLSSTYKTYCLDNINKIIQLYTSWMEEEISAYYNFDKFSE